MMAMIKPLESTISHRSWTINPFDARPELIEHQSAAENWTEQMSVDLVNGTITFDPPTTCSSLRFCFFDVLGVILGVFGFLTNVITFLGLRRDPDKGNSSVWLLRTLAVVDNVYLSLEFIRWLIGQIFQYAPLTLGIWTVLYDIHAVSWPLKSVPQILAVWIVVLIAVDRYLAMCKPMQIKWRTLRRIKSAVLWLFILAVLLNAPYFLEAIILHLYYSRKCFRTYRDFVTEENLYNICLTLKSLLYAAWVYTVVSFSTVISYDPFIVLIILNFQIAWSLRALKRKRLQMSLRINRVLLKRSSW